MKDPPSEIAVHENIGRQLFSSGLFSSEKKKVKFRAFYQKGESEISVDRLDHAPPGFLREFAERSAAKRKSVNKFYGWAKLTVKQASKDGRWVEADPQDNNPFHAIIHLTAAETDDGNRRHEAMELARDSEYIRPNWNEEHG